MMVLGRMSASRFLGRNETCRLEALGIFYRGAMGTPLRSTELECSWRWIGFCLLLEPLIREKFAYQHRKSPPATHQDAAQLEFVFDYLPPAADAQ